MPDGHSHSEYRHKSLESGVMRKYHAPFGGRPTEKGSIKSTSPAAHPTQSPAVEPHTPRYHVYNPMPSACLKSSFFQATLWPMGDAQ